MDINLQKKLIILTNKGDLDGYHLELSKFRGQQIPYNFFKEWVDIISCSGISNLSPIIDEAIIDRYGDSNSAILKSYLAVEKWLNFNVHDLNLIFSSLIGKSDIEIKSIDGIHSQAHMKLIARLLMFRLQNQDLYNQQVVNNIFAIGDSHTLSMANAIISLNEKKMKVVSLPIRGIKMFHIGSKSPKKYNSYVAARLSSVPLESDLIFSVGEIDSRPNEGMFPLLYENGNDHFDNCGSLIEKTVGQYTDELSQLIKKSGISPNSITLMGVPQPGYNIEKGLPKGSNVEKFLLFLDHVNETIKTHAYKKKWGFIDLGLATKPGNYDDKSGRIDTIHMSPLFYSNLDKFFTHSPNT